MEITQEPIKYCLYARKSSEAEERQALSIDSQVNEMLTLAQRENLNIVDMYRESHSAKDCGQRPVYNKLLLDIREGKFDGILVWHPDRLARNAGDLGAGLWPSVAPTGYLNHPDRTMKCHVVVDPLRSHIIKMMFEKAAYEKFSGRQMFRWLKDEVKFTTKNNKPLTISNIYIILRNNFYMGLIEYPRKSGKWYAGKHEPIISQELFRKVQEKLDTNTHESKGDKEFAFTRLMKCGMCKSGVTAEEKYKNLADGSIRKYIYYGCTKFHDKNCKNTYLPETDLISQLIEIIDRIDINQVGIKGKLEKEIERYGDFRSKVLGMTEDDKIRQNKLDIRGYMKYILEKGAIQEKRELMQSFTSKLILINKRVVLE